MSNSLYPDWAWHFIEPYLGSDCLQRLPADNTGRQEVKSILSLKKRSIKIGINGSRLRLTGNYIDHWCQPNTSLYPSIYYRITMKLHADKQ